MSIVATLEGRKALHIRDEAGQTLLHAAALNGHAAVVAQLLQARPQAAAIINVRSNDGSQRS